MPLTAGGKLTIIASSDLGGLGAKDGAPVEYNWMLPGAAPLLWPWLVILGLLALKPNRRPAAWLIWLPLGAVMAAAAALPRFLPDGTNFLQDAFAALAFGTAAVWLLANYLRCAHRWLTFLGVLVALGVFSSLTVVFRLGWSALEVNTQPAGIVLAAATLANATALTLDGWICRNRFRPAGICLWLLLSLAVVWLLIAAPFFVFAEMSGPGRIPLGEFFHPVLAVAAANFLLLLPFLILSSASGFFRERFKALFNIQAPAPPMNLPPPPTDLKTEFPQT